MKQGVSISNRAAAMVLINRVADMIDHIPDEDCNNVCVVLSDAIKSGFAKYAQEKEQLDELQNMPTEQLINFIKTKKRPREEKEEIEIWTPSTHYLVTEIIEHTYHKGKPALRLFARVRGTGASTPTEFIATSAEIDGLDHLSLSAEYIKKAKSRIMEPFLKYFAEHPIEEHISLFTSNSWGRMFLSELHDLTKNDYYECDNPKCKAEFCWQDAGYTVRPPRSEYIYCNNCKN
jgi:hypothetical protein